MKRLIAARNLAVSIMDLEDSNLSQLAQTPLFDMVPEPKFL
jgi:hypothetical protein